jgi:hypothetical protein
MNPVVVVIWVISLPPFPPTAICVPPVTPALSGMLQVSFVWSQMAPVRMMLPVTYLPAGQMAKVNCAPPGRVSAPHGVQSTATGTQQDNGTESAHQAHTNVARDAGQCTRQLTRMLEDKLQLQVL